MIPVNGSLKPSRTAGSGGGVVRTAQRPIVPALPLRLVQHRPTRSEDHRDTRTPRSDAVTSPAKAAAAAAAAVEPNTSGGREKDKDGEENKEEKQERKKKTEGSDDRRAQTNGAEPSLRDHLEAAPAEAALEAGSTTCTNGHGPDGSQLEASHPVVAAPVTTSAEPSAPHHPKASAGTPANLSIPTALNSQTHHHHHHHHRPAHHPSDNPASPQQPPPVSPTREQPARPEDQPPPPPDGPINDMSNGNFANASRPIHVLNSGPPSMLHTHPSQGHVHFGTLQHSSGSSPAPPQSAGMPPPPVPGMPMPDGRAPPMMQPNGSGYPPMMPYGSGPMFHYPPGANCYPYRVFEPSRPPSYHGSQSSAHPEDGGMYPQYQTGSQQYLPGPQNGAGGAGNDQAGLVSSTHESWGSIRYSAPAPYPGMPPPPAMSAVDDAENLLGYLQQQFAHPELADCALELRYSDDRAPPLRISGHSLIFRRSPRLYELQLQQAPQMASPDGLPPTLLLETDSTWIRSDSFYMAVQRLYGLPLLHWPYTGRHAEGNEMPDPAGSTTEQMEFALSYAAAGHLLEWAPVVRRGAQIATYLLGWQTLERVLAFALEGYEDKGTYDTYGYGEGSTILLCSVVTFIIHNFPSSLSLDVESASPVPFGRFPLHLPAPPRASGPSVQLGRHGRGSHMRRSIMQFGDLSFNDAETAQVLQQAQPASHVVLSRILLDLPFTQLKMILESSGSGNVQGWAHAEARFGIIKAAVEEREARRRRALEIILAGQVADAGAVRAGLCSPEPCDLGAWSALGWQEEMLPPGNANGPSLVRKWVPWVGSQPGPVAQYR